MVPASCSDQISQQITSTTTFPYYEGDATSEEGDVPSQEAAVDAGKDVKCEESVVSHVNASGERAPIPDDPKSLPVASRRSASRKALRTGKLPASRSSDRRRSQQTECVPVEGKSTSLSSVIVRAGARQRRPGCRGGGSGHPRGCTASSNAVLAWKPAGTNRVQDSKRAMREHSSSPRAQQLELRNAQCNGGGTQSTQKGKNRKDNKSVPELASKVDKGELKGLSRMPVLKVWDAHDFVSAQRLGFSLEKRILRHGRPQHDASVNHSWTDEEYAVECDDQVPGFH